MSIWPLSEGIYAGQPDHQGVHNTERVALNFLGRGRYFVEDYGAVGDGATDDAAAINAAISAAGAAGGGYVHLRAGKTYAIADEVVINQSNVILVGYGATVLIKALSESSGILMEGGAQKIHNSRIVGLTLDANYGNQVGGNQTRGIEVTHADNCHVIDVRIDNAWVSAALSTGTIHCSMTRCYASEFYNDGLDVSYSAKYCSVIDCGADSTRENTDHSLEIEDGVQHISIVNFRSDTDAIGVKNHDGAGRETYAITLVNCHAPAFTIVNEYPSVDNYVKDVSFINCVGQVSDPNSISGLHIITPSEVRYGAAPKVAQTTAPADGDLRDGELALWWDEANSQVAFKAKQADGTVKVGVMQLM